MDLASVEVVLNFGIAGRWLAVFMRMFVYEGSVGGKVAEAIVVAASALIVMKKVVNFIVSG